MLNKINEKMPIQFEKNIQKIISTDTATLVIFDPACLLHRLTQESDWWSIASEELAELNAANAVFLNLGSDGNYEVHVETSSISEAAKDKILLNNISGRFFIGAAEDVTGGDLEPSEEYGGFFIDAPPHIYGLTATRTAPSSIQLSLTIVSPPTTCANRFKQLIRL